MIPFRTFKEAAPAKEMVTWLQNRQVKAAYHEAKPLVDTLYFGSMHTTDYIVSIAAEDFEQARDLLHTYYQHQVKKIPADYYLFNFTNTELTGILAQPDLWGDLDYVLAQEILEQRGIEIPMVQLRQMQAKRTEQLMQPQQEAESLIYIGFALCLFCGLIGSLFGWYLANAQRILPDGNRVPIFNHNDRNKGRIMVWLGLVVTVAAALCYFSYSYRHSIY